MFVSFEGCEGVGKSTQLKLLKDYLEATGQHAVYVREPGSTEISEQIRKVILNPQNTAMTDMTEALLYAASRAQLVREVIKPALEEVNWSCVTGTWTVQSHIRVTHAVSARTR